VREAVETLRGGGPEDLREHCLTAGAHLLVLAGKARSLAAARARLAAALHDGSAFAKFRQLVLAQGGDVAVVDHVELLPRAALIETVAAPRSGFLAEVNAREVGLASVALGAGRAQKSDLIDHAVGLVILHKVGDAVKKGEALFEVHANDAAKLAAARERVLRAHRFSAKRVKPLPLFYGVVRS
jgi:pyrimidine-nucleoside phosphorylase